MKVHVVLLLCLANYFAFGKKSYDGYQLIQVTPTTVSQVEYMKTLEANLDFWRGVKLHIPTEILLSEAECGDVKNNMESQGIYPHISIPDMGRKLKEQEIAHEKNKDSLVFYDSYHDLDEINQWVDDMAATHGDLCHKFQAATSYEGRDIFGLHIRGNPDSDNPAFWFDGGIHSREWVSPSTVMYMAEQMMTEYGSVQRVTDIMDNMDFFMVPVVNVDGYVWTWTDDRLWRKTRSPNEGSSCLGTDPNRNWDVAWNTVGTSSLPCTNTYAGSEAFSEIEVRSVAQFVEDHPEIVAYFGYHSYGQMYMTPYGYTTDEAPHFNELIDICSDAIADIQAVHGVSYVCDSLTNLVGPNSGSSVDYTYEALNIIYSFGVELRDTGEHGFTLPEDQILPTGEESYAGLLVFAEKFLEAL